MEPMLKVTDLSVSYGHVEALRGVSIQVEQGQIVSIIGANGAGKSTLLRTISGLVKPLNGRVEFLGEPLPRKPNKIVAKGIVHVPEGRKTFSGLTIRDNLLVGGYLFKGKELEKDLQDQYKLFPFWKNAKQYAARSRREQQMLAGHRFDERLRSICWMSHPWACAYHCNPDLRFVRRSAISITVLLVEQTRQGAGDLR
jgi:branched-chain amino acid transport system ATP-binding protein